MTRVILLTSALLVVGFSLTACSAGRGVIVPGPGTKAGQWATISGHVGEKTR